MNLLHQRFLPEMFVLQKDPDSHREQTKSEPAPCFTLQVFQVEPNKRYRFRLISNAILNCPLKFSIDNHRLNVIASDAGTFQPREVRTGSQLLESRLLPCGQEKI